MISAQQEQLAVGTERSRESGRVCQEQVAPSRGTMQPGMQLMAIVCPPGCGPGQQIQVDVYGQPMMVAVPVGVRPGQSFQIQVPMQQQQQQPQTVVMAQPVQPGYGGQQGYQQGYPNQYEVHVMVGRGRRRLTQEGWCWVIVLLIIFWPICWLPFVMEGCYENY